MNFITGYEGYENSDLGSVYSPQTHRDEMCEGSTLSPADRLTITCRIRRGRAMEGDERGVDDLGE